MKYLLRISVHSECYRLAYRNASDIGFVDRNPGLNRPSGSLEMRNRLGALRLDTTV